jgi:hypothetical protein
MSLSTTATATTTTTTTTTKNWASHLFSNEKSAIVDPDLITEKDVALSKMMMLVLPEDGSTTTVTLWHRFDHALQCDRDVALAAVKTGCFPSNINEWPTGLRHDIKFWRALLSYQGNGRYDNHRSYDDQMPSSNAWCVPIWRAESQILSVFHCHPILRGDVNFWYTILHSNYVSAGLLTEQAHPSILQNKSFISHALQSDHCVYQALSAPLNIDEDIVTTTLQQHTSAIMMIPAPIQELYSDAVVQSIRKFSAAAPKVCKQHATEIQEYCNSHESGYLRWYFCEAISPQLWANRDVILAWATIGGEYRVDNFPPNCADDEELFLLFAQHRYGEFEHASTKLRSDKEYMKKAIGLHGELLLFTANNDLKYDYDLAVIAFSNTKYLVKLFVQENDIDSMHFLMQFYEHLVKKKMELNSFFLVWMAVRAVTLTLEERASCPLLLLNQGSESTTVFLKMIQQFVGVPSGLELRQILLAKKQIRGFVRDIYMLA